MVPLAVHIADVLPAPWWVGGFVAAAALLAANARRLADDEIPRLALVSAAFFVASLIHVRVGPTSVHLLLNGLVGLVLGRRAVLAVAVGLVLQAALVGHGGFSSLGVNICVMTLPAYLAAALFAGLRRLPGVYRPSGRGLLVAGCVMLWGVSLLGGLEMMLAEWRGDSADWLAHPARWWTFQPLTLAALGVIAALAAGWERRLENSPDFPIGLLVGEVAVLATVALNALVLRLALPGEAGAIAPVMFVAHLPIAALEGVICGFAVGFLLRVAPHMLADSGRLEREDLVERDLPLPQADADHG
ncbi:MAG TPA: energy-coupling factor ABC transporter permease [Gemmataceae bacterium]|jgi:cobalt/nickel transport system permease protein